MSWSESWYRVQRKRTRLLLATVVAVGLLAAAVLLLLAHVSRDGPSGVMLLVGLVNVLFMGIPLAFLVRHYIKERAILRRVPELDGLVCPRCRWPLTRSRDATCPKCRKPWSVEAVRAHWEQYPYQVSGFGSRGHGLLPSSRLEQLRWSLRNRPWCGILAIVLIWLVAAALWSGFTRLTLTVALVDFSKLLFMGIGVQLIGLGAKRRVGASLHCAKCDYEKAAETGTNCPECGQSWTQPGAVVRGRMVRSPHLMWAGALFVLIFLSIPASQLMLGSGFQSRITPTWLMFQRIEGAQRRGFSSHDTWAELSARSLSDSDQERLTRLLIEEIISAPRGFVYDEWAVLSKRMLTREQELTLFRGLLDKRDTRGYFSPGDEQWLLGMVQAGAVTDDLAERFQRE